MNAILMSILAALAWGAADYGAAVKTRTMSAMAVTGCTLAAGAFLAGLALLVHHSRMPTTTTLVQSAAAAGLTVVGLTALYMALGEGRMSIVAPISATGVAVPVIVGLAAGESLTWFQAGGIAIAISGMIVLIASVRADDGATTSFRPVALAAVAAAGLGVFYLVDSGVKQSQIVWFVLLAQVMAALVLGLVCIVRRTPWPRATEFGQLGLLGALGLAAWLLATRALSTGPLSLTSTITALYPAITVVLAICFERERPRLLQVAALLGVFAGVGAIAA